MMHRKWSIFWMSSEKLGTGGRRASAVPNLMYSILIIEQNRGNFLGKSYCCAQPLTRKPKTSSALGKKPKKRCTHDSTQWNFLGKKLLLYPNADKEAKIEQRIK